MFLKNKKRKKKKAEWVLLLIRRATGVTLVRYRLKKKKKPRQASFEAPTPGRTFGECVRRVHKRAISPHYLAAEWIQAPFTAHSNACACSREGGRVVCARTRTREWICHLIIMRRKILANGEHTEGCNYDPFQRAHALWQCLHFHPDGERERETEVGEKKIPKEWWENVSFIAIKDNNSRQENCFNCFWGREQIGADGGDGWKWGWQWEEEWHFWMAELLVKGV